MCIGNEKGVYICAQIYLGLIIISMLFSRIQSLTNNCVCVGTFFSLLLSGLYYLQNLKAETNTFTHSAWYIFVIHFWGGGWFGESIKKSINNEDLYLQLSLCSKPSPNSAWHYLLANYYLLFNIVWSFHRGSVHLKNCLFCNKKTCLLFWTKWIRTL